MTPLVSVLMSVYKEPIDWLHLSIDSIINQTFKDFEFIIICDNPQYKESISLLNEYEKRDERIRLIVNDENIGLTKSLNKGLDLAKGKYIARMDADDVCYKDRLECQLVFLEQHPDVDICGTFIRFFDKTSVFSTKVKKYPEEHKDIIISMLFENPFAHSSVMMKKHICGAMIMYDESVLKAQDYKLWYDMYRRGAVFANVPKILLRYRISKNQISNKNKNEQFLTGDYVRSMMLKDIIGSTSEQHITIHNDICKKLKSNILLNERLEWICNLINLMNEKERMNSIINKIMFNLWFSNCLLYPKGIQSIMKYPLLNIKLLTSKPFLNSIIKNILSKFFDS